MTITRVQSFKTLKNKIKSQRIRRVYFFFFFKHKNEIGRLKNLHNLFGTVSDKGNGAAEKKKILRHKISEPDEKFTVNNYPP